MPACLYREQVTISKALTLVAEPGAEIRGSRRNLVRDKEESHLSRLDVGTDSLP